MPIADETKKRIKDMVHDKWWKCDCDENFVHLLSSGSCSVCGCASANGVPAKVVDVVDHIDKMDNKELAAMLMKDVEWFLIRKEFQFSLFTK